MHPIAVSGFNSYSITVLNEKAFCLPQSFIPYEFILILLKCSFYKQAEVTQCQSDVKIIGPSIFFLNIPPTFCLLTTITRSTGVCLRQWLP